MVLFVNAIRLSANCNAVYSITDRFIIARPMQITQAWKRPKVPSGTLTRDTKNGAHLQKPTCQYFVTHSTIVLTDYSQRHNYEIFARKFCWFTQMNALNFLRVETCIC
jgi:hypothetical protein